MEQMPNQQMPPQGAPQQPGAGPQPTQNIGFNQDMQNILFSRISSLNEQDVQALDDGISMEAVPVLKKIFPEIGILLDQLSGMDSEEAEDGMKTQQGNQQANPLVQPQNSNVSRNLMG